MTTRSPYPDTEAAASLPRLVLDRADERSAAAPLMGPADQGTARPLMGPGAVLPVYLVPTLALLLATGLTAEARLDVRPSLTRKYTRRVERWRDLSTIPLQAANPR